MREQGAQCWPGAVLRAALIGACLTASGCLGPAAVRSTRMKYNEAVRSTNDEQLLMNIVRLRYADSPIFLDLPNITSQFELSAGGSDPGRNGGQTTFGIAGMSGRDSPTLSYHPRQGREIAKALLNPLSADLFSVVNAGARLDQLLWMTLNDINDVQNAVHATALIPSVPDDNRLFLRGVRLLADIDDRGGLEIGFSMSTSEDPKSGSDAISAERVQGADLLGAARDGFVYRAQPDGRMALYKREKELTMKIRTPFSNSAEMKEIGRIFHLTAGLNRFRIDSELQPGAESSPPGEPERGDTMYLNLRSILQIMTFLSKGVRVPDEHNACGMAPVTPGPDGAPYDWTQVMDGNFAVSYQKHRPRDAEVAVQYRDYWFYIARDDVNSRAVLAVLEILFSLQDSDDKSSSPVLTLPAGR